ncbi:hypothetical protein AB0942_09455 [Streptomyces nodosus]|uniref:hypothetical protein n=1 Tax=Streptomyces nodosus TaxID=40318 RepID=UPI003451E0AA
MSSALTVVPGHAGSLRDHPDRSPTADGAARPSWPVRATPAGCFGQQYLEHQLLSVLADGNDTDEAGSEGPLAWVTAASAGWGCLHLQMSATHAHLFTELLAPRTVPHGPYRTLEGIAGLRQTARDGRLAEFTLWGGHGRLVLHLDAPPAVGARPEDGAGRFLLLHEQVDPLEDARRRSVNDSREDLEDTSAFLRGLLPGPPAVHLCGHPPPNHHR